MISIGNFAKRVNHDSTIDLICTLCFQTAATGRNEEKVFAAAQQHACFPFFQERDDSTDSQRET